MSEKVTIDKQSTETKETKPNHRSRSKIDRDISLTISIIALIVAIFSCWFMYKIYDLQKTDNDKQNRIDEALRNGDAEFEKNNWEEAYQQYYIADSLGSTDKRGYINFKDKAYEEEKMLGECDPIVTNYFEYANKLSYTDEIDQILKKCTETK
jgi:cell division protein FtsL